MRQAQADKDKHDHTELWTVSDLAKILGVGRRRVLELVSNGIPHLLLGKRQLRFRPRAIEAWLQGGERRRFKNKSKAGR